MNAAHMQAVRPALCCKAWHAHPGPKSSHRIIHWHHLPSHSPRIIHILDIIEPALSCPSAHHHPALAHSPSLLHLVWMILRNSWPERGLKMKMAPLMGLVVRLPSKVL